MTVRVRVRVRVKVKVRVRVRVRVRVGVRVRVRVPVTRGTCALSCASTRPTRPHAGSYTQLTLPTSLRVPNRSRTVDSV